MNGRNYNRWVLLIVCQRTENVRDLRGRDGVQSGGRLVQDQDVGTRDKLETNADPTHFTTADPSLLSVADSDIADLVQAELFDNVVYARTFLRKGDALRNAKLGSE